jgi:ADP-ribose pyrophosphatase
MKRNDQNIGLPLSAAKLAGHDSMGIIFLGENLSISIIEREVRSRIQKYEVVNRPRVSLCVPMLPDRRIVLVKQFRPSVNQVTLEFPAGKLEEGEEPVQCARREILEEAGFEASSLISIGSFLTAPHFSDERVFAFLAIGDVVRATSPTEKEALQGSIVVEMNALEDLIESGQILDSKSISAFALVRLVAPKKGIAL